MHGKVGQSDRARSGSNPMMTILACLFLSIGVLIGSMFSEVIRKGIGEVLGGKDEAQVARIETTELTKLGDQLGERVKDACSFLQALISLVTVIVALIGIALGVSIWRTEKYAQSLISLKLRSEFKDFRESELEPLLVNSKRELNGIHGTNLENFLETYRMAWVANSQVLKNMERQSLELSNLNEEDREEILKKHSDERENVQTLTYYRVCLIPNDEDLVINAAQHLGVMGRRAKPALLDLEKALNRWRSGTKPRMEIQRAVDKIKVALKG